MHIHPDALLIQLNQPYGPFPASFGYRLKEGYSVFVGRNDAGKSIFLQRIFVHFCNRVEFGRQAVCYIGPDRQYVKPQSPPPASLDQYNVDLLNQITNSPRGFDSARGPDHGMLYTVCLHRTNFMEQINAINSLLARMGFDGLVLREMQAVYLDGINIYMHGSGVRCVLPLLAGLTSPEIKAIVVDEPEVALEARAQRVLKEILLESAGHGKLIFAATQSHIFVDKETPANNFLVLKNERGESIIDQLTSRDQIMEVVFNLLGNSLEDLLFPNNFLFVEGSSDQVICEKVLLLLGARVGTVKVISARGIDNAADSYKAISNTLIPLVADKSPYSERVVVLVDLPNEHAINKFNRLREQLGERCLALDKQSVEEYVPEQVYLDAGRNRTVDLEKIKRLRIKVEYGGRAEVKRELWEFKKEISNSLAGALTAEHLDLVPIMRQAAQLALSKANPS